MQVRLTIPASINVVVRSNINGRIAIRRVHAKNDPIAFMRIDDVVSRCPGERSEVEARNCRVLHELAKRSDHCLLPRWRQPLDLSFERFLNRNLDGH